MKCLVSETGDSLYDAFIRRLKQLIKEKMMFINMKMSEFITSIFTGIFSRVPRQELFIQPMKMTMCEMNNSSKPKLPDQISSLLSKFMFTSQLPNSN